MKSGFSQFVSIGLIAGGLCLTGIGLASLRSSGDLNHSRNPFAVQKSAYGKLFARLSESTVDRVWHLGVEQINPHDHGHGDHSHGHGHDHGDHSHSHEDHSHDHGDHSHSHEDHSHDHRDHGHDHGDHSHDQANAEPDEDVFVYHVGEEFPGEELHDSATCTSPYCTSPGCRDENCDLEEAPQSFIDRSKEYFDNFTMVKYTRTTPYSLSEAHLAWAKKDVEKRLLRSYKMDPLHYGAYNSYHLFLTAHQFGGTDASREKATLISRLTIQQAFKEKEDPEPYVTAASALLNLFFRENGKHMQDGTKMPLDRLKKYRNDIQACLSRFKELQAAAEENGTWANLSRERQMEISSRIRFAHRTFEQFDVMIARAEERNETVIDEEVAEILDFDR